MSPPLPPSPPLGPPFGTNFSLRKAMQPCPPFPARTVILASSINMGKLGPLGRIPLPTGKGAPFKIVARQVRGTSENLQAYRLDTDEAAGVALIFEGDYAGDFCKESIVSA